MSDFFLFKPAEYVISNPDKSNKFYYGKADTGPGSDPSLIPIYNSPHITETSLPVLMKRITSRKKRIIGRSLFLSLGFTIAALPFSLFFPKKFPWYSLSIFYPIIFIIFFILLYILFYRFSGFLMLKYLLKGKKITFYQDVSHHLSHLIYADNIWHVNKIVPNRNPKDFGGVKEIYHRCHVKIKKTRPFFIESNISIYNITYGSISLYFFPDCILVKQRSSYSYYLYSDLFLYYTEKPSLEKKNPPGDAQVIGKRWLHPNKDGSKDKRYKFNPQIPVLLLSELLIYFKGGFQTYLQVSNIRIALAFFTFLSIYAVVAHKRQYQPKKPAKKPPQSKRTENRENFEKQKMNEQKASSHFSAKNKAHEKTNTQEAHGKQLDKITIKAFRMLGVLPGTVFLDVKRNYRLLVLRYHPDRNAQGNELMKKFAENKIRDINKAYAHLKRWFSDS